MGHLGPKRGQNGVFCHFLIQKSLVFADFSYYVRYLCYLVEYGGQSAEKKSLALKWAHLGLIRAQKVGLVSFLEFG